MCLPFYMLVQIVYSTICNDKHVQIWGCHGNEYWDSAFWGVTYRVHREAALKIKAGSSETAVHF
jgi:hypothetical protein